MQLSNNQKAFLALVRAGLWADIESTDIRNHGFMEPKDWKVVYQQAAEQSVIGLVLAGLEHTNIRPLQELLLQWIGEVQKIEQRNREMNDFIASIIEEMRKADIYGLLVKGSGLAQCYERPLWRSCGDIDFFFSKDGYKDAVAFFLKQKNATQVQNAQYTKSFGVVTGPWFIELHGTLRNGLSSKMDLVIDEVQRDIFYGGNVRSWQNGKTQVFLPGVDNDVFLVFVHFVRHFYKEGVCLRQICDWCRLIWTYQDQINFKLLESRLRKAGLMSEWKAFAALAVDYLGIPTEALPLYDDGQKWHMSGGRIMYYILDDRENSKMKKLFYIASIFSGNTFSFLPGILFNLNGKKIRESLFRS